MLLGVGQAHFRTPPVLHTSTHAGPVCYRKIRLSSYRRSELDRAELQYLYVVGPSWSLNPRHSFFSYTPRVLRRPAIRASFAPSASSVPHQVLTSYLPFNSHSFNNFSSPLIYRPLVYNTKSWFSFPPPDRCQCEFPTVSNELPLRPAQYAPFNIIRDRVPRLSFPVLPYPSFRTTRYFSSAHYEAFSVHSFITYYEGRLRHNTSDTTKSQLDTPYPQIFISFLNQSDTPTFTFTAHLAFSPRLIILYLVLGTGPLRTLLVR